MTTLRQRAILKQIQPRPAATTAQARRERHAGDHLNGIVGIVGVVAIVLIEAFEPLVKLIGGLLP